MRKMYLTIPNCSQKFDIRSMKTSEIVIEKMIEKCSENPSSLKNQLEFGQNVPDDSMIGFKSAISAVSSYNEKIQKLFQEFGRVCSNGFEEDQVIMNEKACYYITK